MFWENFVRLCTKNGTTPTAVTNMLRIARGSVTNWKKGATPNPTTAQKIANYFNVSVDCLLGNTLTEEDHLLLSEHEKAIIKAYRAAKPSMQEAIDKLLGIDEETLMREILSNTEVISITTKSKSKTKV